MNVEKYLYETHAEYYIYDENVLGYYSVDSKNKRTTGIFNILRSSILKGSYFNEWNSQIYPNENELRKATEQDFEDFRTCLPPDFK